MGILYKGKITWVCLRWSLFSQWESHHLGNQLREYVQFCWSRNQVLICLDQLWSAIDLRGYCWNTRPGKRVAVCDIEHGPVEIVDLLSYNMSGISSSFFVNVYQRVNNIWCFKYYLCFTILGILYLGMIMVEATGCSYCCWNIHQASRNQLS